MRGWVRLAVAGCAIVALAATGILLTRSTSQAAACTDSWVGGVDNNFGTAGNWSTLAVPGSSDDACISGPSVAGITYTVVLNGGASIRSLTLGGPNGTQTLVLSSGAQLSLSAASAINGNGVLTMGDAGNGNSNLCCAGVSLSNIGHLNTLTGGGGTRIWQVSLTNGPGGSVDIAGPTIQDSGGGATAAINLGTVVIDSTGSLTLGGGTNPDSFSNQGGSVTNNGAFQLGNHASFIQRSGAESGAPVTLNNGSTLDDDTSAAAASFSVAQNGTILTGTGASPGIAANQVLTVASDPANTQVNLALSVTNNGTITLGGAGNGASGLCCAGLALTNGGHLNTLVGGGGYRYIHTDLVNTGSGSIDLAGPTIQDGSGGGSTTTINNGTVVVEPTGSLTVGNYIYAESFRNSGGAITNNGAFIIDNLGTFVQRGGTESGASVTLNNGSTLDDDAGAAAANFGVAQNGTTLTGTGPSPGIGANQMLTVASDPANTQANLAVNLTNNGTITLGGAGNGASILCCAGVTLTNGGRLNTVVGGGASRYFRTNLFNATSGNIDIAGPTLQDGSGGATTMTNNGAITLEKGETLALSGGSTFTQGSGGTLATNIDANTTTFGQLTGGGSAVHVDGKLKVTTVGSPGAGSSWPIIANANRSGQFASLDFGPLNYVVQYPASGVTLVGQAPCDYWIGGNGNFNTPSNWSFGTVPGFPDDACMTQTTTSTPPAAADTYTVLLDSNTTISTLKLGGTSGTQTLQLAGNNNYFFLNSGTINRNGVLLLGDGNASNGYTWLGAQSNSSIWTNNGLIKFVQGGGGTRLLRVNLSNNATGTVDIASGDTRQDPGGSAQAAITNSGTFTVESGAVFAISNNGAFTSAAGTITNNGSFSQSTGTFTMHGGSESGNPIVLSVGTLDDDLNSGAGNFTLSSPNGQFGLTGTGSAPGIAAGQVVTVPANNTQVNIGVNFTNAGTLTLDAGAGHSVLCCVPVTLTNTGQLNTVAGGPDFRYLRLNITNAASGVMDLAATTVEDPSAPGTITNNGAITIEAGGQLAISGGSSFVNSGGSAINRGAFNLTGGTFTQRAGTESINPVVLHAGATLDDDVSAGTANFTLTCPSCSITLTGTGSSPGIAAGQVVTIPADNTEVNLAKNLTNAGNVVLGDAGTGFSWLNGPTQTLTNTGQMNAITGGGGSRYLRLNINNAPGGTIDVAAPTRSDGAGGPTTIVNDGVVTIEKLETLALGSGSAFTQHADGTLATTIDATGTTYSQLTGGIINLDGKLRVTTVGWPSDASSWPIISGATRSGTFATIDICGPNYEVQYSTTGVTLVVHATLFSTFATGQLRLASSDGTNWQDMDLTHLSHTFMPTADSYAIVSGNADLWTSVPGYNQDLGISISGGGTIPGAGVYPTVVGQPEAWKESGGFAGTFSPNAAFVQTVVFLKQGLPYTVKLVWKANKNAPGATIWAGAGPIGGKYSPTRLAVQLLPASTSNLRTVVVTDQPNQSGSDGATWKNLDAGLTFQYTPCLNGQAVVSGNVDLWTSAAGFNQDVGITVSGGAYPKKPGQPEAWKESGGFAGTFSPNAAFVQTVLPLNANTTYTFKLTWKTNKPSPASSTIWAGAGPIGNQYSPTRLMFQFVPSTGGPLSVLDAMSKLQYTQRASDGATWKPMDLGSTTPLKVQFSSATACTAIVSANADLWTDTAGYNQDIGIFLQGGGYPSVPNQPEAWKESGGYAGTYSPNAAFVQIVVPVTANTLYAATLEWKANRQMPAGSGIWTGAGPIGSDYSPTRLTVHLLGCS